MPETGKGATRADLSLGQTPCTRTRMVERGIDRHQPPWRWLPLRRPRTGRDGHVLLTWDDGHFVMTSPRTADKWGAGVIHHHPSTPKPHPLSHLSQKTSWHESYSEHQLHPLVDPQLSHT